MKKTLILIVSCFTSVQTLACNIHQCYIGGYSNELNKFVCFLFIGFIVWIVYLIIKRGMEIFFEYKRIAIQIKIDNEKEERAEGIRNENFAREDANWQRTQVEKEKSDRKEIILKYIDSVKATDSQKEELWQKIGTELHDYIQKLFDKK